MLLTKDEIAQAHTNIKTGHWTLEMFTAWIHTAVRHETYQAFDDGYSAAERRDSQLLQHIDLG
jgi:hypothetical protein